MNTVPTREKIDAKTLAVCVVFVVLMAMLFPTVAWAHYFDGESGTGGFSATTLGISLGEANKSGDSQWSAMVTNAGKLTLDYTLGAEAVDVRNASSSKLCSDLTMTVKRNENQIYNGSIDDFSAESTVLSTSEFDNFTYTFEAIANRTYEGDCEVTLTYKASQTTLDFEQGFYDKEVDSFTLKGSNFGTGPTQNRKQNNNISFSKQSLKPVEMQASDPSANASTTSSSTPKTTENADKNDQSNKQKNKDEKESKTFSLEENDPKNKEPQTDSKGNDQSRQDSQSKPDPSEQNESRNNQSTRKKEDKVATDNSKNKSEEVLPDEQPEKDTNNDKTSSRSDSHENVNEKQSNSGSLEFDAEGNASKTDTSSGGDGSSNASDPSANTGDSQKETTSSSKESNQSNENTS